MLSFSDALSISKSSKSSEKDCTKMAPPPVPPPTTTTAQQPPAPIASPNSLQFGNISNFESDHDDSDDGWSQQEQKIEMPAQRNHGFFTVFE